MATVPQQRRTRAIDYPTGDGKPLAETELHINDEMDLIQTLGDHYEREPMVYVAGNLLVFYEEGDRRKHVAPDVFVVRGVEKKKNLRGHYLIWEEKRPPEVVIELTSKSTRNEDKTKFVLYRDTIRVFEYFLFDPTEDYLKPSLQGFRLIAGDYLPIEPGDGRLPSQVLGLHLERDGKEVRFYNPATGARLLKKDERTKLAQQIADEQRQRADEQQQRADEQQQRAEAAEAGEQRLAEENERLRQELEALRRGSKSE